MAHRKTEVEAKAVAEQTQARHPELNIIVKPHQRGGYLILESRTCERCGTEYTTSAIGEIDAAGNLCRNCKQQAYDEARAEREAEANIRSAKQQAYYDAEAWYYAEER